jgi:hypothetical protein
LFFVINNHFIDGFVFLFFGHSILSQKSYNIIRLPEKAIGHVRETSGSKAEVIMGWTPAFIKLALQFLSRLLVIGNAVHIRQRETALIQTIADGVLRYCRIVFSTREPFFLRSSDQRAVPQ